MRASKEVDCVFYCLFSFSFVVGSSVNFNTICQFVTAVTIDEGAAVASVALLDHVSRDVVQQCRELQV
jgi:hypothetical protein